MLPLPLETLICSYNQLTTLPELPSSILLISCRTNQLVSLPALPNKLNNIECSSNKLTVLPSLPESLRVLYCNFNRLTALPVLPRLLVQLDANFNCYNPVPTNPNPSVLARFSVTPNSSSCTVTNTNLAMDSPDFSIYPNPLENKFYINTTGDITSIAIFNSYGQMIYSQQSADNNQIILDEIAEGIYTIKLMLDGQSKTVRVIKK